VSNEIRALLARHLPGYEVELVAWLGEGLDNVSYEVNAELIVRKSKEPDPALRGEATRRQADLLAAVAELSTLPVPEPIFADPGAGVLAYPKLSGVPLMDHPVPEPARLAPALGGFLGRLHRIPLGKVEHLAEREAYPLAAWRDDAEGDYRKVSGHLPAAARRRIEDFLGGTLPAEPRPEALCHNDLGAEHMLVDVRRNAVTGIIDWGDAAIADPALDLALVYRDLGLDVFGCVLANYVAPFDDVDRERAVFYARCKLIEDVAYGVSSPGTRRYAEAALAHLDRTFGDLA
jgi:aminoglycoside phosphotransferase (APT) family kinase protein